MANQITVFCLPILHSYGYTVLVTLFKMCLFFHHRWAYGAYGSYHRCALLWSEWGTSTEVIEDWSEAMNRQETKVKNMSNWTRKWGECVDRITGVPLLWSEWGTSAEATEDWSEAMKRQETKVKNMSNRSRRCVVSVWWVCGELRWNLP